MKAYLLLIFVLAVSLFSCSERQTITSIESTFQDTTEREEEEVQAQIDDECVFDTSNYKFTTEALLKYSPKLIYSWDTSAKVARVRLDNGDSLALHIGGCNHFGFQATLLTSIDFSDSTELFEKTKWIAKTFFYHGFEEKIPDLISKRHINLSDVDNGPNFRTYTFEDQDTTVTNLILDGFTFEKRGEQTIIEVGAYIN